MASQSTRKRTEKRTIAPTAGKNPSSRRGTTILASTLYSGMQVWDDKRAPSWHPIQKMRYVFFRMIGGLTVSDAIKEISWTAAEFWHLVDLKRHAPFREEYKRAKILQGRAFADSVVTVAEGRDRITRAHAKRIDKLVAKTLKKIVKQKSRVAAKVLFAQLLNDLRETDKVIMTRNKLQMDAAKWIAKTANPMEFSESARIALGGDFPGSGEDGKIVRIQFVGPDGKAKNP